MKNLLLIILFTLKLGVLNPPITLKIDKEIQPLFDGWLLDCNENKIQPNLHNLELIQFSDTINHWVSSYSNSNQIIINERFKDKPVLKVIVYYNLGKEILNIPDDTIGVGIMNPFFDESFAKIYLLKWDKYKNRYFEQATPHNEGEITKGH